MIKDPAMKPFWDLMDSSYSQARVPSPGGNAPDYTPLMDTDGDGDDDASSSDVDGNHSVDGYEGGVGVEEPVSPSHPITEEPAEEPCPEVLDTQPDSPLAPEIPDSQPQDEETWKLYFGSCAVCGKSGPHDCADSDVGPSKAEVSQEMDHIRVDLVEKIKKIKWGVEKWFLQFRLLNHSVLN